MRNDKNCTTGGLSLRENENIDENISDGDTINVSQIAIDDHEIEMSQTCQSDVHANSTIDADSFISDDDAKQSDKETLLSDELLTKMVVGNDDVQYQVQQHKRFTKSIDKHQHFFLEKETWKIYVLISMGNHSQDNGVMYFQINSLF